jgi:hypothetical protein
MPGANVHLWIGYRVATTLESESSVGDILLGSISPDAVHVHTDWSRRRKILTPERMRIWFHEMAAADRAIDLTPEELEHAVRALRVTRADTFGDFMSADEIDQWKDSVLRCWIRQETDHALEATIFTVSRVREYAEIVNATMRRCRDGGLCSGYRWITANYPENHLWAP